jgi:hypothetical protein
MLSKTDATPTGLCAALPSMPNVCASWTHSKPGHGARHSSKEVGRCAQKNTQIPSARSMRQRNAGKFRPHSSSTVSRMEKRSRKSREADIKPEKEWMRCMVLTRTLKRLCLRSCAATGRLVR